VRLFVFGRRRIPSACCMDQPFDRWRRCFDIAFPGLDHVDGVLGVANLPSLQALQEDNFPPHPPACRYSSGRGGEEDSV
ncbi:hypothetical protein BG003_009064, partial [Podila horticola]